MEERKISIEHDAGAEDVLSVAERLLTEFGVKYEVSDEGNITYWVENLHKHELKI